MAIVTNSALAVPSLDKSPSSLAASAMGARVSLDNVPEHQVGIDVGIDLLGIGQAISDAITAAENRDAFVKNLLNTAWYAAGEKYNVMVFNLDVDHDENLENVQLYGSSTYEGIIYGIWVFESGTFENKGDGGYINWAFRGWFERDGGFVSFHLP